MNLLRNKRNALFPFCWRDALVTLLILSVAVGLSFFLRMLDGSDACVPMLFVTAVCFVSRFTDGYLFGTVSSVLGVFLVNYVFTYPYFAFDFTVAGYPVTFTCLFAASVLTSAMTSQIKHQERLRVEAEREQLRANLLRAVSHDLRTPLTSIVGTTSALLENGDRLSTEEQRTLLRENRDDAAGLVRMVENLLSITRMNASETVIHKAPEAVEEIVSEAVRKFGKQFPAATVDVSVPEALLLVPMDAILIEQVLINLLENAVLHGGEANGIRLGATAERDTAVFTVSDRGCGIRQDRLAHLFDGVLPDDGEACGGQRRNMGIGLSVCMSIVKAHGGSMSAENRQGGGAEFCFTLPLEEEAPWQEN